MKLEVVEFYPMERDDEKQILKGSLHVYLPDMDVDLRGVMVRKRKNSWFFGLPTLLGIDPDTGKKVRFPVFAFVNREKTDELRSLIREKGKEYVMNHVLKEPCLGGVQ